jgi:hypothetical protein
MRRHGNPTWLLLVTATLACTSAHAGDPLCKPMRAFVSSIGEDEKQELVFRTRWGGDFKDEPEEGAVLAAKRCERDSVHAPSVAACKALMEEGAIEFSDGNVRRVVACLSRGTKFAPGVSIPQATFHFSVGTPNRGAWVTVEFVEDEKIGGMAMRIVADGY